MGGRGASSASHQRALAPSYHAWQSEAISEADKQSTIAGWKGSSSNVRHAINGRASSNMDVKTAEKFDDWLNSGSYNKTLYRGKRVTKEQLEALKNSVGALVNQDGPASFSKSLSVAQGFASGGYNHQSGATQRVIFKLEGGTKAGQDIAKVHGFQHEKEVAVGSASHLLVKSVETKVIGGKYYTIVSGTEVKKTYVSPHKQK